MFEVGRVCVKLAGRDAGKTCIIVDIADYPFVLVDGATRRRKTNIKHLIPTPKTVSLKAGASHEDVAAACKELSVEARSTKPKNAAPRPKHLPRVKVKKQKKAPAPVKKTVKKEVLAEVKDAPKAEAPKEAVKTEAPTETPKPSQ